MRRSLLSPLRGFLFWVGQGSVLAFLSLLLAAPALAAQEPPGVWFLVAGDEVRFAVGGTAETPPRHVGEEMLGWEWTDAAPPRRYPGAVAARYRPSGAKLRTWHADGSRLGVPKLGIGPGRELLLLGDDEPSTAAAMLWAEVLDGVEAAWRHSSPDLTDAERHGVIDVGRVGRCRLRSAPVGGAGPGWSGLRHKGVGRAVEIQRFLRLLDGPTDCGGRRLELAMMPTPRAEPTPDPYLVAWSQLETRPTGFLDLEPTPRTPAVRTLAREPKGAREQINLARWPRQAAGGVDLCRAPFMRTLCLKDLRIREQLATAAVSDPSVAAPLEGGCRAFFDRLPRVPSPHPCSDPKVWRRSVGVYRTGYTGEMPLRQDPGLLSRVDGDGRVQWLWPSTNDVAESVRFPLADGTRVALVMPQAPPPVEAGPTVAAAVPAELPPTAGPAMLPTGRDGDPAPSTPRAAAPPLLPIPEPPPAEPTREAATPTVHRPTGEPTPDTTAPAATAAPPATPGPAVATAAAADPEPGAETSPAEPSAGDRDALRPPMDPPASAGLVVPVAMNAPLWPLTLAALALTVVVALLLLGQRALARSRRRSRAPGLAAAGPPTVDPRLDAEGPPTVDLRLDVENVGDPEGIADPEDAVEVIVPLEPPKLITMAAEPAVEPSPIQAEWRSLPPAERRGIETSLAATGRLGRWIDCLMPVFDDLEQGRGGLPGVEALPPPARREWRRSVAALRRLADRDLAQLPGLLSTLEGSGNAEAPTPKNAGLFDTSRGSLRDRLRRHLLAPRDGRLQQAVLALQYLIEAFPVEHLEAHQRKSYRSTLRRRLEEAGLSTRFHDLAGEIASGLGRQYRRTRYYKTRLDQPEAELLRDAQEPISLSERVGYPAGTDAGTVVRISEVFLVDPSSGERTSGLAHVDGA